MTRWRKWLQEPPCAWGYAYLKFGLQLDDMLGPDVLVNLIEGLAFRHLSREVGQDPDYVDSNQNDFVWKYLI